ncbi:MAG: hypothetical protein Fur0024_0470 [Patescibacteria group bacterium]
MKKTEHLLKDDQIAKKRANRGANPVVVDVGGKSLGRAATEVVHLIMGKDDPQWSPFLDATSHKVIIKNLNGIVVTGSKFSNKNYFWHTEYFGGIKETNFAKFWKKNPKKLFERTVFGMLPKNKLRNVLIKNLTFEK